MWAFFYFFPFVFFKCKSRFANIKNRFMEIHLLAAIILTFELGAIAGKAFTQTGYCNKNIVLLFLLSYLFYFVDMDL